MRSIPLLADQKNAGWGMIELPADRNISDNRSYFTFGGEVAQLSVLVADKDDAGRILSIACAPDPEGMNQVCLRSTPDGLDEVNWSKLAMLVWQDGSAGSREAVIESFCRISSASLSARIVYAFADLFLVQWKENLEFFPKAEYAGKVF